MVLSTTSVVAILLCTLALTSSAHAASCNAQAAADCATAFAQCTRANSGNPCTCYQPYADCLCNAQCSSSVNGVYSACSESVGAGQCSPSQCPLPCDHPTPTPTPTTQVCSVTTLENCHKVRISCVALKEYEKSECECYFQEELCLCRVGCTQAADDQFNKCVQQHDDGKCGGIAGFRCVHACTAPPKESTLPFRATQGDVNSVTDTNTESTLQGNVSAPAPSTSSLPIIQIMAVCVCIAVIAAVVAVLAKRRDPVEGPSNAEPLL